MFVLNSLFSESMTTVSCFYPQFCIVIQHVLSDIKFELSEVVCVPPNVRSSPMPGQDGILSSRFRIGGDNITALLILLFKISNTSAVFLSQWKTSVIIAPNHPHQPYPCCLQNYGTTSEAAYVAVVFIKVIHTGHSRLLKPSTDRNLSL